MFSVTKLKNSAFALSLILFLIPVLSGCASSPNAQGPDRSVLPESLQSLSFDEHLDISIGYWNIDEMAAASEPDAVTQYIEELFNITIHPVSVSWSNYKERYQILSATDSLPDVFATLTISSNDSNDSALYEDMIQSGSIRPLPDDLSSYPQLEQILSSVSYTRYSDGQFYAIPRVSFTDEILGSTDAALLVRRDWMDALGISDPQNFDEFAAMVSAFAHDDPDGNGINDTIGYNVSPLSALGKWVMLGIAPQCNTYSWIEQADGRFVPSWTNDAFTEVVRCYRRLYEEGGLDPEFYSKSSETVREDFASGRLGALEYKSSPSALMELKQQWDALNELPFEECVDVLPIFPSSDGVRYSNSSSVFWSESYISSSADDAKVERILALFEYLLSEEGQNLCHYGLEGVDYEREADGSLTCLLDTEGTDLTSVLMEKYPSIILFNGIASWGGGWSDFEVNEINALRYGESAVRLASQSAAWNRDNTTQISRPYAFLNAPKEPTDQFSTSAAFSAFVRCIIGNDDPAQMWEDVLEEMRAGGLEEYIDRQNESYH
ncbi:MAG: extracellular solute-binding protein [Eubacteriales bacterium]|nr:extracellular solute-binding protein [Eubacteriales bacterium]